MTAPVPDPLEGLVMPPGDPERLDDVLSWLSSTARSLGEGAAHQRAMVREVVGVSWTGRDAELLPTAVEDIATRATKASSVVDHASALVRSCQGRWIEALRLWRRARIAGDDATTEQAQAAGMAWVGDNPTLASDGKTWVSQDGLRQYRPPTYKPNLGYTQANFESRNMPNGQWQSNGHLNISDTP